LSQNAGGVCTVPLHRQKNGNPAFVAVPPVVAEAVLGIPPMSEQYFF
jgi:hypothetical protein